MSGTTTKYYSISFALLVFPGIFGSASSNEPDTSTREPVSLPRTLEELKQYMSHAKETTDQVISAKPFRVNGHIIGYYMLLSSEHYKELFSGYGFQKDDVFTKVNGIPLVNKNNAIKALKYVVDANLLKVELIRDGEIIDISLQFK